MITTLNTDMRAALTMYAENSMDSTVCDPPYNLDSILKRFGKPDSAPAKIGATGVYSRSSTGFAGQTWDTDIAFDPDTWRAVLRVMKPGAHLVAFAHSTNYHKMATAIEQAGFIIRDQIMWLYGSGMPKTYKISDVMSTSLKPAHEPIVLAMKPLSERTFIQNVMQWGTGGIITELCRVHGDAGSRYPANVLHDGLTEEWSRYFYHAKASHFDRVKRCVPCQTRHFGGVKKCPRCKVDLTAGHPTVKPLELMKYLCRLVTPPGGTILDPFAGTGSTIVAARDQGFDAIGIEMLNEYYLDMKWRLTQ